MKQIIIKFFGFASFAVILSCLAFFAFDNIANWGRINRDVIDKNIPMYITLGIAVIICGISYLLWDEDEEEIEEEETK